MDSSLEGGLKIGRSPLCGGRMGAYVGMQVLGFGFRVSREQLDRVSGLVPERQGQNLALTAVCVSYSLDHGRGYDTEPHS